MNARTVSEPRVRVEHPRRPEPSYAELIVALDWLRDTPFASCRMSEDELAELAESALHAAGMLRRNRASGL